MDLFLVRHGETEIGDDHLYPEDAPLTPLGRRQAEAACRVLAGAEITHIVTSGLTRAIESAGPLVRATGLEPRALSGLDEIRIGEFRSAPIEAIVERLYHRGPHADFSEFYGENAAEFAERILYTLSRGVVDAIREDSARVAIFAHGGTISVILDHAQGRRFEPRMPRLLPNGCVSHVRASDRRLSVVREVDTRHLVEIGVTQMHRPDRLDQSSAADSGA